MVTFWGVTTSKAKRRKPAHVRKQKSIRMRVNEEQKQTLVAAAARDGLGLSAWLLAVGMREARRS